MVQIRGKQAEKLRSCKIKVERWRWWRCWIINSERLMGFGDGWMERVTKYWMDFCDCRVAFMTEKLFWMEWGKPTTTAYRTPYNEAKWMADSPKNYALLSPFWSHTNDKILTKVAIFSLVRFQTCSSSVVSIRLILDKLEGLPRLAGRQMFVFVHR